MNVQKSMIAEERAARRQKLIWKGVLHHDNQSTDVRIRNISTAGAMVESAAPVAVGSELMLQLSETVSIRATVEWAVDDQAGLRFRTPFDLAFLAQARPAAKQSNWAPPAYLDSAVLAAWERRLRRLSPAELRAELERFFSD